MADIIHVKLWVWLKGCGYFSSCIGANVGDRGGEVEETELVLLGRLIRPPNEPNIVLKYEEKKNSSYNYRYIRTATYFSSW